MDSGSLDQGADRRKVHAAEDKVMFSPVRRPQSKLGGQKKPDAADTLARTAEDPPGSTSAFPDLLIDAEVTSFGQRN